LKRRDIPAELRAVLFDLDGVIIDSMPNHVEAWTRIFARLQLPFQPLDIRLREGEKAHLTFRLLTEPHRAFNAEEIDFWVEQKRTLYRSLGRSPVFSGIIPVLDLLHEHGIKSALVTGSGVRNLLSALDPEFLTRFDLMLTAEDYRHGKPTPEPYRKCLELLELDAAQTLVVENAPLGIQSAVAAGIYCTALTTTLPEDLLREADMILKNHKELAIFLASVIGEKTAS
jgi:beta-phosphoglucomutase